MDNFIVHIKSEDVYADLAGDIEKSFHTSNYEVDMEKQNDGLMEDELGGRIANQRCAVIWQMIALLLKGQRVQRSAQENANLNLIISERLENNKMVLKAQQTLRSKAHNAFTEKVNKIPVSANIT